MYSVCLFIFHKKDKINTNCKNGHKITEMSPLFKNLFRIISYEIKNFGIGRTI